MHSKKWLEMKILKDKKGKQQSLYSAKWVAHFTFRWGIYSIPVFFWCFSHYEIKDFDPKEIYLEIMHINILLRRCFSFIGRVRQTNGQELSIGTNCAVLSVIIHEVLHALGFIHEHTRLDRDTYVIINETNIQPGRDVSRASFSK